MRAGIVLIHGMWGPERQIPALSEDLREHGFDVARIRLFRHPFGVQAIRSHFTARRRDPRVVVSCQRAAEELRSRGAEIVLALGVSLGGTHVLSLATSPIASIDGYVGAYCEPPALIFGPGLPSRVLAIYGGSDRTLDPSVPQLMRASLGDVGKVVVLDAGHDFLFRGEAAPRPLRWITRRLGCIPDNQALEASLRWIVEFAAELPIRK